MERRYRGLTSRNNYAETLDMTGIEGPLAIDDAVTIWLESHGGRLVGRVRILSSFTCVDAYVHYKRLPLPFIRVNNRSP